MCAAVTQKQILVIHLDNSPIHKSKAAIQKIASLRLKIANHPPYSPDLAQSDFLLFEYIKQKIAGQEFVSADGLLKAIREAFGHFSRPVLESVFDEWLMSLQRCINYQGSYFLKG
jgi:histone-lysine N-methyltransferase SETMAR